MRLSLIAVVATVGVFAAGCGGGEKKSEETELSKEAQAACTGTALTEAPKLPASFPQIEEDKLTYKAVVSGPDERDRGLLQR